MKFNFRRIASVLASVTMVASTVAIAAAANFPAPFVTNGHPNVAIVYGSNSAAVADLQATTTISDKLATFVTGSSSSGSGAPTGGDFVKLEKTNNKFNLGENPTDVYPKLTSDELPVILSDDTYTNVDGNDYDYTQTLQFGSDLQMKWFANSDFNEDAPEVGFDLADGNHIANYTLEFDTSVATGADFVNLKDTDINILGKTFYISDAGASSLTLLDTANSVMVTEGTASSVNVGGTNYDIEIVDIDSSSVILKVNGVQTKDLKEGQTRNLGGDVYLSIKDIRYKDSDTKLSKVEVSIGTGKIVLTDGDEVELNANPISDTEDANGYTYVVKSYFTNTSSELSKIVLEWDLDSDAWVVPGKDLVMPGLDTIKFSMGGFVTPSDFDSVSEKANGKKLILKTPTSDTDSLSLSILYLNDTEDGIGGVGESASKKLVTSSSTNTIDLSLTSNDQTFLASYYSGEDSETHVFTYSIDDTNKTTLTAVGGKEYKLTEAGDTVDVGEVTIELIDADKAAKTVSLQLTRSGSGTLYADRIFTKKGLMMMLPVNNDTINLGDANDKTFNQFIQEQDEKQNVQNGGNTTIGIGITSNALSIQTLDETTLSGGEMIEVGSDSGVFEGYINSKTSTKLIWDKPTGSERSLEMEYYGDETYGDVYVSEAATTASSGNSTTTNVLGNIVVKDTETAGQESKNWIVVGGSCVNTVAATLLGSSVPVCGDAWQQKTGVGSGQFLIQTFTRSNGKIATLVAGYGVTDTANAATALTTKTVDTTAGKKYTGGSDMTLTSSLV